jgi:carbon storage regulator
MLVLTRKKNETIRIGGNVVVKVISTGRGKVKIGIEAPATVRVRRGELAPEVETVTESDEDEPLTARVYRVALA